MLAQRTGSNSSVEEQLVVFGIVANACEENLMVVYCVEGLTVVCSLQRKESDGCVEELTVVDSAEERI